MGVDFSGRLPLLFLVATSVSSCDLLRGPVTLPSAA